ncbi:MAG TPA: hypothetical protein VF041_19365 [Gemmatimonadaceae bacterium]
MSDESGAADAVKDAKGVVEEFVGVLVLVDIVLGALALYWARLAFPDAGRELPGTGYPFVDVALLACAAAIVGKMVSLVAGGVAALVLLRAAAPPDGPFARMSEALAHYLRVAESDAPALAHLTDWTTAKSWKDHWAEILGGAAAHLASASPAAAARLERERSTAELTYGVAVLVLLFGAYLAMRLGWWVGLAAALATLSLLYSGRVRQRGWLRALAHELDGVSAALAARRAEGDQPGGQQGGQQGGQPGGAVAPKPAITEEHTEAPKPVAPAAPAVHG